MFAACWLIHVRGLLVNICYVILSLGKSLLAVAEVLLAALAISVLFAVSVSYCLLSRALAGKMIGGTILGGGYAIGN